MRQTAIFLFALLVLTSCTTKELVVVVPVDPAKKANIGTHCSSPDDGLGAYLLPAYVVNAPMQRPPKADTEHVSGCAAVKFHLTAAGKATEITVLREYPADYGYGDAAIDSVQRSTFKPGTSPNSWYFMNIGLNMGSRPAG